jgi:acetylornithine deacetylase
MLQTTLGHLRELIGFPTVSSDSNLNLIAYVEATLKAAGARTVVTHDAAGAKANVFATIGPEVDGGVVLSGHTDVVPVAGQNWHTDPFQALDRDGRIYGRDSCDMKSFIAAALTMAPHYAARKLTKPVHFAFTFDEETSCLGAPVLLE